MRRLLPTALVLLALLSPAAAVTTTTTSTTLITVFVGAHRTRPAFCTADHASVSMSFRSVRDFCDNLAFPSGRQRCDRLRKFCPRTQFTSICPATLAPTTTTATATTSTAAATTTTAGSTTTTTLNFVSRGFVFAQNLTFNVTTERFGAGGNNGSAAIGTPVISPAHGTASLMTCVWNVTPLQAYQAAHGGAFCGNVGNPACPVWSACLQQSNTAYDEAGFADTALCCSSTNILTYCNNFLIADNADVKDGGLLTFRVDVGAAEKPTNVACSVLLGP